MAINYSVKETIDFLTSNNMGSVKEVTRKYPLTVMSLTHMNEAGLSFFKAIMGDTSCKSIEKRLINAYGLKAATEEDSEETEDSDEAAKKAAKAARKAKKEAEEAEDEADPEDEDDEEEEAPKKNAKKDRKSKKSKKAKKAEPEDDDDDDFDFD